MPVKARRYYGTKTHDNEYFKIKWYNNWHMDKITLLKSIDRDSNIRVNYTIKELSGKVRAYSDVNFCDHDIDHPDGSIVQLVQKALYLPHKCPLEPAQFEIEEKSVDMDIAFNYDDVDCSGAEIDIKLLTNEQTLLEGTWGIIILDKQCHHWFSVADEL
ncbi:hypothetical protein HCN44_003118 [Aphidius gifuensis]|uniref:Uncharacterized protein n=1 Tax=Aphidius gifuensis TaxID=684658 RepID=A0A834XI59_APHGI|nr:hypothetical protein HCN44_003118 [Aphidius gifuensis]